MASFVGLRKGNHSPGIVEKINFIAWLKINLYQPNIALVSSHFVNQPQSSSATEVWRHCEFSLDRCNLNKRPTTAEQHFHHWLHLRPLDPLITQEPLDAYFLKSYTLLLTHSSISQDKFHFLFIHYEGTLWKVESVKITIISFVGKS